MRFIISVFTIFMALSTGNAAEVPFHRGFNLSGWLEQPQAEQIQFTRFTKEDFVHIKNMGCDHIRLPMHLFNMAGEAPDYTIDPLFFFFLDQIVDWAEDLQLHLILDNHSFDPAVNTSPGILGELTAVWKQMAERYKNRSNLIYYEILNEPHGIADATWNDMQKTVIDTIRTVDRKHTLIVGPAGWNGYNNLKFMPVYSDTNLIYTFHFYDPFLFTHQGAGWVDPPMNIAGVPFPYDAARMPSLPNSLKGTWIESIYNNYPENGTDAWVKSQIDIAINFMKNRNVPLWCGEFGAHIPNSTTEDRARWLQTVHSYFQENGIAWSMWEFAGSFGIFKPGSNGLFDYDVNIPIIEALGLTPPPQKEFRLTPDTTGFKMYNDFIAPGFRESSWISNGTMSFYSQDRPLSGQYCIHWAGADRYNNIGFQFAPVKDMSELVEQGFAIDFWIRCAQPSVKIDIRFLDTKTDVPEDHPWRMRYTIDNTVAAWDGQWNHLQILLQKFSEQGAWDNNQWYNPRGDFDWTRIDRFEIVAEHSDLHGIDLYFDNIRIVNPNVVQVQTKMSVPVQFNFLQNYPNPFNPTTRIQYNLAQPGKVDLTVFDVSGQKVRRFLLAQQAAGQHTVTWNARNDLGQPVSSGVYFCRLIVKGKSSRFSETKKMILVR